MDTRTYSVFNRETFIEALRDWGFTGSGEIRPVWLDDAGATEFAVQQAAGRASQEHARGRGLVQQTIFGKGVLDGEWWTVPVTIILQGGAEHYFEYRSDPKGIGQLFAVRGQ